MSMSLREAFEPRLLSRFGYQRNAQVCAAEWDSYSKADTSMEQEIARATRWLAQVQQTKKINRWNSSYGYKHMVERWSRWRYPGENPYVANGCFIMAALRMGFLVQRCPHASPNAWLNISKRSLARPDSDKPVHQFQSLAPTWTP
jgi:hypothetical protein